MSKFKFFQNCDNIEDLKANYKKLAMQYHPDRPQGNLQLMQEVNAEYEILFALLKNKHKKVNNEGNTETYTATEGTNETAGDFINVINELLKYENITIELVGNWLWVTGETKVIKDDLKKLGFFYNGKRDKTLWMLKPDNQKHRYSKNETSADLKNKYGCQSFKSHNNFALA